MIARVSSGERKLEQQLNENTFAKTVCLKQNNDDSFQHFHGKEYTKVQTFIPEQFVKTKPHLSPARVQETEHAAKRAESKLP